MKIFAIYIGDQYLFDGTADEIAERFNVTRKSVYYWNTPAYKKRTPYNIRKILVKLT